MRFFLLKKNRKPYTYYVDGDIAASGNGRSLATAFKTIAEALAVAQSGQRIWVEPKDDGSPYREEVILPVGVSMYSKGRYNHTTHSWSGGARISGADIVPNANFSKSSGYTNVYQANVTVKSGINQYVLFFENDLFLARRTSIALVDSNPGSYYVSGESGAITVYIHAFDSSSPIVNGKTYEVSARLAIGLSGSNTLVGLQGEKSISDGGCIIGGAGCRITHCAAVQGGKHNIYYNPNNDSTVSDCLFRDEHYSSGSMLVINANNFNGESPRITRCSFILQQSMPTGGVVAHNGHNNISGTLAKVIVDDCYYEGFSQATGNFNHCNEVELRNIVMVNCQLGMVFSTPTRTRITGTNGYWRSNKASQRCINFAGGSIICEPPDTFTIYQDAATDLGMVTITGPASVTLNGVRFVQGISIGTRIAVYCNSAGANLSINACDFSTGNKNWTYLYYFHASASGMTWQSDNNVFEAGGFSMYIFGTTYSTLASYQAGVSPRDANSTAV